MASEIDEIYVTLPEIVRETGQSRGIVYNWFKYHRYMDLEYKLGKPVVKREVYEQFKIDHPELVKSQVATAA